MNNLLTVKIIPVTFFRGACPAFCDFKSCSESHLWSWKLFQTLAMNVHWRKSTNESEEHRTEILKRLLEQSLELVFQSVFKEAGRNFLIIFLYNKTDYKF